MRRNPLPGHALSSKPLLLIVDDDPLIGDSLAHAFADDFDVVTSNARAHCLALLEQLRRRPEAALVDLGLPPCPHRPDEGFALIADLLAHAPDMKIVVLSGQNDEDNARHARTLGAIDFVGKPCDPATLLRLLGDALAFAGAEATAAEGGLLGESAPMQRLRLQLAQYADLDFPVLIEGESGSGKDIVAQHHLHRLSARCQHPFLAINCAAIAPTLLEPTLFGHARGAFTGAGQARAGYFEEAGEGTLFLDEIGELPLDLQPKLLRVLENGEYQRVGETQTRLARARIVAATNRDLRQEVRAGRFRADLYHRLSVFTVAVPPLRETGSDRLLLLNHFRRLYAAKTHVEPFTLDRGAEALWLAYGFPGNVRELRNIAIRLTARHAGQSVDATTLAGEFDTLEAVDRDNHPSASGAGDSARREAARSHLQGAERIDLDATLAAWERSYIDAALELSGGNVSEAARRLGVSRTTLYSRMESRHRS
jgi:two-component system nitrogen regulation response regulator GlnG